MQFYADQAQSISKMNRIYYAKHEITQYYKNTIANQV